MGILGGILGDLINPVKDLISEVVVDKDKARELNVELEKLADQADARIHEQVMGQIEVNKEEAKHSSLFVAGWRPFVGWTSGVGLGYATILQPLMTWVATVIFSYGGTFPEFDTALLITILGGMLGLSGLRTYEKKEGVHRTSIEKRPEKD